MAVAVIGTGVYLAGHKGKNTPNPPPPSPTRVAPTFSPSPTPPPPSLQVVLPPPGTAGGMVRDRIAIANPGIHSAIYALLHLMESQANATSRGAVAVYEQPGSVDPNTGGPKELYYLGIDSGLSNPATFLNTFLHNASSGLNNVRFFSVAAGPGGGTAQCVTYLSSAGVGQWSECGWATQTTVGDLEAPSRDWSPLALAALMRQMRPKLESSG